MIAKILGNKVDLLQVYLGLKKELCGSHRRHAPYNQWCKAAAV